MCQAKLVLCGCLSVGFLLCMFSTMTVYGQADDNAFQYDQTIYVSPSGGGNHSGSDQANPMTLQAALSSIGSADVRILLLDGRYREYYNIGPGDNVIVLEAQNPGQAIICGSDIVTSWHDEGNGVYSIQWNHNWGLNHDQFYFPGDRTRYNLRRELLFVDGRRLLQRVNEDTSGSAVNAASLNQGEFTVDEPSDRMLFKPPAGVAMTAGTFIEVGIRGYDSGTYPNDGRTIFRIDGHSHVKVSGLVFQHAVNYILQHPVLEFAGGGGSDVNGWPVNIKIEHCAFVDNNGVGLGISTYSDVTVLDCDISENGERGAGGGWLRNVLIQDCRIDYNGWRFGPWLVGHDMAGIKFFDGADSDSWFKARSDNIQFIRCRFRGNQCKSYWVDYFGTDITIDSCLFEDGGYSAIEQEVTPGPLTVTDSVIRRCGTTDGNAITIIASPDVRFLNCTIYDCGAGEKDSRLFYLIADTRTAFDTMENFVRRLRIEDSIVQANLENNYGSSD